MTTRLVADGKTLSHTATGNGNVGYMQAVSTLVGVVSAIRDNAAAFTTGDVIELMVEGVFNVEKVAEPNSDWVAGDLVYYRVTGGRPQATAVAAGGTVLGTGWAAAVTGAATGWVKLKGHGPGV